MHRHSRATLLLVAALAAGFTLGAVLPAAFGRSEAAPTVVRNALAQANRVQGASNRTLALSRVVVPPGAKLALHRHLGTQVARIQSGVLRYTVRRGTVGVRHGDAEQNPNPNRKIEAGETVELRAGNWIVEQPSVVHRAENDGGAPVVIYLATLLPHGAPPSTPVSLPAGR